MGVTLKERICSQREQIVSFESSPLEETADKKLKTRRSTQSNKVKITFTYAQHNVKITTVYTTVLRVTEHNILLHGFIPHYHINDAYYMSQLI